MMMQNFLEPLIGGGLIGFAVTIMLLFNGRVTGISGILSGSFAFTKGDTLWRLAFVGGLISGGLILKILNPAIFENTTSPSLPLAAIAGLIVGFGTIMGSGCTSGHGVCGISRMSIRSLIATSTFMAFGFLTVAIVRFLIGGAA